MKINYKNWAFRFAIWIAIINVIVFYLVINTVSLIGDVSYEKTIFYLGILATLMLVLCIIFIIISTIKKESKDYRYWLALTIILFFGIAPILLGYL